MAQQRLAEALATIPDRRRAHLRVHDLVPLLLFAVAAMLCGAHSLYAMAQWGRERLADQPELLVALGLRPGRSPCVATLHRVFKGLDVAAFDPAVAGLACRLHGHRQRRATLLPGALLPDRPGGNRSQQRLVVQITGAQGGRRRVPRRARLAWVPRRLAAGPRAAPAGSL